MLSRGRAVESGGCRIDRPSAGHAVRADVAVRAPRAGELVGPRGVVAGADPGRCRGDLVAGLAEALRVHLDLADEAGLEEVQRQRVRQAPGQGLIAHRIDLELERLA